MEVFVIHAARFKNELIDFLSLGSCILRVGVF
jgi:hypothetical protein